MFDVLCVVMVVLFFALNVAFADACENLMRWTTR
jgi:hypothetical protein